MNEKLITLDWNTVVIFSILYFVIIGWVKGWQRSLVTLVSLFFAWGVSIKTVEFLIRAIQFMFEMEMGETAQGLFQVLLYLAATVMVLVTFNLGKVIPVTMLSPRDRLSGISVGILNGYFFVVLLLDIGGNWFADNFEGFTLSLRGNFVADRLAKGGELVIQFINNPIEVYGQLLQAQNLVLLGLLVVFFHGFVYWLLGGLNRRLLPSS